MNTSLLLAQFSTGSFISQNCNVLTEFYTTLVIMLPLEKQNEAKNIQHKDSLQWQKMMVTGEGTKSDLELVWLSLTTYIAGRALGQSQEQILFKKKDKY